VSLHSGIIGTASYLSELSVDSLSKRTKIISVVKSHPIVRETVVTLPKR
jgi:hypothetical protein